MVDVANMKQEIIELREFIQRLAPSDQVVSELDNLKEEIFNLKTKNAEIVFKIQLLEEEMERDPEDKSDEDDIEDIQHLGTYHAKSRKELECHNEKASGEVLKCHKCDFTFESTTQLKKHMNTKHPYKLKDSDKI